MNKKNYFGKKKIISFLLAAVMIAALVAPLSVSVSAAEVDSISINITPTSEVIAGTTEITISGTVQGSAANTATITLTASPSVASALPTITNTNGSYNVKYTFDSTNKGEFTITAKAESSGVNATANATVNVYERLTAPVENDFKINYTTEKLELNQNQLTDYKINGSKIVNGSFPYTVTPGSADSYLTIFAAGSYASSDWSADSASGLNYKIDARPSAPIDGTDYSVSGNDVIITSNDIEYKTTGSTYTTATNGQRITLSSNLRLRFEATATAFASLDATPSGSPNPPPSGNREPTPTGAYIDHANHFIGGLDVHAKYIINGYSYYTANSYGRISISSVMLSSAYQRWDTVWGGYTYAYDINVVKMGNGTTTTNSLAHPLIYYTNQGYGYNHLSAHNESGAGRNDGYIYGLQSAYSYEYKLSSQPNSYYATLHRSSSNSNRSVDLAPGTYDVRINYYNSYGSYTQTLTIYPNGSTGWATVSAPSFSAEYSGYSYRPSAKALSVYNPSSQTMYINNVTVSGYSFDIYGSTSSISAGSSTSSYTIQPRANLSPGTYNETVTVTYHLGSSGTVYTASAQVSFTILGDYYDYYDYTYYYSGTSSSAKSAVVDSTSRSSGSISGVLSYYNKAEKNGEVDIDVTTEAMTGAIDRMKNERSQRGRSSDSLNLTLNFTTSGGYSPKATVELSQGALLELVGSNANLIIVTDTGSITFPSGAVRTINSASSAGCVIKMYKDSKLSNSLTSLIGSRPAVEFKVYGLKGEKMNEISSFGTQITVSINYNPGSNEKTDKLGVYRISGGKASLMKDSSYSNGVITWSGNSLSMYAVGYDRPAPEFKDTAKHWAKANIEFIASRGILTGTAADVFSPDKEITRAMFVTALGRISAENMSSYKEEKTFTDVESSSVYHPYIEWAYANKIITRPDDGKFEPGRAVTREEMALMMYKYAAYAKYKIPSNTDAVLFSDANLISSEAKNAVKAMQTAGIIKGKNDSALDPQGKTTRAEASAVLQRFVVNVIDASPERGWVKESSNGRWQYINGKGDAVKGWLEISNATYYFEYNGYMATDWLTIKDEKYYFGDNGVMAKLKWVKIGSDWYYFDVNGVLAVNTTVDGYKVDENGVRK